MKILKKKYVVSRESSLICLAINSATRHRCVRPSKIGGYFCVLHTKRFPQTGLLIGNTRIFRSTVFVQNYLGIPYFIDDTNNVYDHEDILRNKRNPSKIGRWTGSLDGSAEFTVVFDEEDGKQESSERTV